MADLLHLISAMDEKAVLQALDAFPGTVVATMPTPWH
jgi:hypothetical protein